MTTIIPTAEPESYLHTVENWILSAVKGGRTSFSEILGSLPGVYPPIAFSSLQGLVSQENKLISQELLDHIEVEISREQEQPIDTFHRIKLPIPHPLDYDWRFHDAAVRLLLDRCTALSHGNEMIVLLGTPSVLHYALEHRYPRRIIARRLIASCGHGSPLVSREHSVIPLGRLPIEYHRRLRIGQFPSCWHQTEHRTRARGNPGLGTATRPHTSSSRGICFTLLFAPLREKCAENRGVY